MAYQTRKRSLNPSGIPADLGTPAAGGGRTEAAVPSSSGAPSGAAAAATPTKRNLYVRSLPQVHPPFRT
jgi:hypothetical protein